ncbi:hypothetical protein D3C80_1213150 [compost metagenome]
MPAGTYLGSTAVFQHYLVNQHIGQHGQVGTFEDRAQKGLGRVPANAGTLVDLKVSTALVIPGVEVSNAGDAALRRRFAERIEDRPGVALLLDPPLAFIAMGFAGAAKVVFAGLEQWQHILPGPSGIALLGPAIVVASLAAHVDHAVDGRTATEHLAPWITQGTAIEAGLRLGLETPVGAGIADAIEVAHRNVNPGVVVAPTGFEQ